MSTQSKIGLSADLASLIHHVELSKAGWRDEAFKILLLSIMGRHGDSLSLDTLCTLVNQSVPASVSQSQVEGFLNMLISSRQLFKLPNGHFKLSEQAQAQCIRRVNADKSLVEAVKRRFEASFRSLEDDGFDWHKFHSKFLISLVSDLGARTYELVTGTDAEIQNVPAYQRFVSSLTTTHRPAFSNGLVNFFDPSSVETRQYMLRLLNNAFLTQAIALPDQAMEAVLDRTRRPLRVRIFVDTNFLFSLLGLHDNPADDVVRTLHDVVSQMSGRIDVKFYVLPFTVEEAQRTLAYYSDSLSHFRMSREVAKVIDSADSGVSGILLTYARKAYRDGKRISAKDYLAPYLSDFIRVARDRGIELFNADVRNLGTDEDVVQDVVEQMERQKQRPHKRQKSYESMCHDMKLWHFVRRRRPSWVDSPLDAEAWVATIDYGLLGFDKAKRENREPPVCIHPTSLLQVLQLWVPSSDRLVGALMESLRPMLPRTLDHEGERISIRIVNVLSRFEDNDLTEEAVSDILLNEALRERIGAATDATEDVKIVESAVVKTNKELSVRLKAINEKIQEAQKEASTLEGERDREKARGRELESRVDTLTQKLGEEEGLRKDMQRQVQRLQETIDENERKKKEAKRRSKRRRKRRNAVTIAMVLGLLSLGVCIYGWWQIELIRDVTLLDRVALGAVTVMISISIMVSVIRKYLGGSVIDEDSRWITWITGWGRKVTGAVGVLVLGLIGAVLASLLRR